MLPADGKLAAAKMEFINMRISARPYRQLEEEYTLTFYISNARRRRNAGTEA